MGMGDGEIECLKMKYKIGDKVKLIIGSTLCLEARQDVAHLPHHIATIRSIEKNNSGFEYYKLVELRWSWAEAWMEDIPGPEEIFEPIENRWDILDLRRE